MADQQPQQEQPSTSASAEPMQEMIFQKSHNIRAFLNTEAPGMNPYKEIIEFLFRSRIYKAINEDVTVFKSHQLQFWNSAKTNHRTIPTRITAKIEGKRVVVTEDVLRRVLEFGDTTEDVTELNKEKVRGCLVRCGYPAERGVNEGSVFKKFFCPPYKYLAHIMIHCLGSRKSGFDQMNQMLQNAFAALVLNMKFNFSRMIFIYLTEIITGKKEEFMLYPRFLQMIFNEQIPDLPRVEGDVLVFAHMDEKTVRTMGDYARIQTRPANTKLFGHLIDPDYVCPPENKWRNEGSESESEDVILSQTGQSSGVKRKKGASETEETAEGEGAALKRRSKLKLVLKERPTISTAPPANTQSIPSSSTQQEQHEASVVASSKKTDDQIAALQSLVISIINDHKKQQEELERLKAEKEERDELMRKMVEENNAARALLLEEVARRQQYEERLKIVEKCYDDLRVQMTVDADGYYRDKDYVDEEETATLMSGGAETDRAGPSGTVRK